jgi:hypothetical protein
LLAAAGVAGAAADGKSGKIRLTGGGDDLFGYAVAPAGDVNGDGVADLLVGAPGVGQSSGEFSGSSYLFRGPVNGSRRAADADATFTPEGVNDNLGVSVGSGDLNNDGFDDVILGARSNDDPATQAGRVYVFFGPVTGTHPVADADVRIAGEAFDEAGTAVAAGDLNGDGADDLVVGAHNGSGPGMPEAGQASVFFGPLKRGGRSVTDADVSLTGVIFSEQFSASLAVADVTGDGRADLIVGATHDPVESEGPGHAYVFFDPIAPGARSASTADAILEGGAISDMFGTSLAAGDLNGDGQTDLAVGANELFRGDQEGRVYAFSGPISPGLHAASTADALILGAPADPVGDLFGSALAITDHNGDGIGDLAVGAWASDAHGIRSGAVWLFRGPLACVSQAADADVIYTGREFDELGQAVADAGDLDRDGFGDLLLGAPVFDDRASHSYVRVVPGHRSAPHPVTHHTTCVR